MFKIPISHLDSLPTLEGVDKIRDFFRISVKRGEADIDLSEKEYGFFFSVIVEFVLDFYNNPQTRDNQEGMMGMMLRGEGGPLNALGATMSIGMENTSSYEFPPDVCEMLSALKFGCALVGA